MIFPICLYEWLKRKEGKKTIPYYVALAVMLLILCVLPAGMSRSAWIAAAVSSIYVCGMHYKMEIQHYISIIVSRQCLLHSNLYFGRYSIGWHLSNEKGFGRRPSVYVENCCPSCQ